MRAPAPRSARGRFSAGFTLLELIVVLAIMGLVGFVVAPAIGGQTGTELKATGRVLSAGLRQARSRALTGNRPVALTVDLARSRIGLEGEDRYRPLPEEFDYDLFTARTEQQDENVGRIRFFPDGSSTGGRVTVSAGERTLMVDVDWFTGRVRILDGRDYRPPEGSR